MKRNQSGFTLVEIAIVLVIIGLLLGGVLKGQELIDNTRVKSLQNDLNGLSAAINGYRDRYNAIPGDDAAALTHGWVFTAAPTAGNGDGLITGTVSLTAPSNEEIWMWQELRAAGFITGDMNNNTAATVLPRSSLGTAMDVGQGQYALAGLTSCVEGVPAKIAYLYDIKYDDGKNNTGSIRAGVGGNPASSSAAPAADTTNYTETAAATFTVCRSI